MSSPLARQFEEADKLAEVVGRVRQTPANCAISEALQTAESFAASTASCLRRQGHSVADDLERLSDGLRRAHEELAAFQPNALLEERLPHANEELTAVVQNTEEAAGAIMACAEAILSAEETDADAYRQTVEAHVLQILEACAFQDITGQRVQKVERLLAEIERRGRRLADAAAIVDAEILLDGEAAESERAAALHLHGPDAPETAKTQDEIDAIFSQDEIDALFD